MRLHEKTAIITGASSGLGRAMARRFAAEGAHVFLADMDTTPREGGAPTVEVIAEEGGSATFMRCDVSRWEDVDAVVSAAVAARGRLDIMVNNAMTGRYPPKRLTDTTLEHW
ncbi:MAG: SDR family NAD(P)-dependent oxidoreductase, partial [Pseudomonadota bacterium]